MSVGGLGAPPSATRHPWRQVRTVCDTSGSPLTVPDIALALPRARPRPLDRALDGISLAKRARINEVRNHAECRCWAGAVTHGFFIQYCGNLDACRTEARISRRSAQADDVLIALVYDTPQGAVVDYFGQASRDPAVPGLDAAVAEARAELHHYINRRGENPPQGITRPGLSLWLTERDDETVIGLPHE